MGRIAPSLRRLVGPSAGGSALAGGGGDEFGDFFRPARSLRMPPRHAARGGGAVDAVFDRVEHAAFGRFDRRFGASPFGGPDGRQQFVEVRRRSCRRCRPRRACGRCRSWSGTAPGRSSGRPATFWAPRRRRRRLERKASQGMTTARTSDQEPEDDEGAFAHLAARILLALRQRYQGHIRRSSHSPQRGFGRQSSRPWRIRFMCSS